MFRINFFSALTESFVKVKPDFIVYNAGTDILKGDRLGLLSVTAEASYFHITSLKSISFTIHIF